MDLFIIVLKNVLFFIFSMFVVMKTKGSLPLTKKSMTGPLIILTLVISAYFINDHLYFNKDKIKKGEIWRLLTSHVTHNTFIHLIFNISGLLLIWILYGNHFNTTMFLSLFLICSIICSTGIYLSNLTNCIGMSGVLMGLFIFGALKDIQSNQKIGYLLLLLIITKIIREQMNGSNMTDILNTEVAIDVHLYGIIGGIISLFIIN